MKVGFFNRSALDGQKSMIYKVRKYYFESRILHTNPAFILKQKNGLEALKYKA
jgi:hypothetical protein